MKRFLVPALALVMTAAGSAPASAHAASPASPAATSLPRYCVAEFTTTDRAGTVTTVAYENGGVVTLPMTGLTLPAGTRLVQPVTFGDDPTTPVVTSLVITRDGILQSLRATLKNPGEDSQRWAADAPVRIGHGWVGAKAVALPGSDADPYLFAVIGGRLNRYHLGATRNGTLSVQTVRTRRRPDSPVSAASRGPGPRPCAA